MKILVITSYFPSANDDIRGNFVFDQVDELIKKGHEVEVLYLVPNSSFAFFKKRKSFWQKLPSRSYEWETLKVDVVRYIPFPRRYLFFLNALSAYVSFKIKVRKKFINSYAAIIAHVVLPAGFVASKITKKYNLSSMVFVHGVSVNEVIDYGVGEKLFFKYVLNNSSKIVFVSSKLKYKLSKKINNKDFFNKSIIIPNGISRKKLENLKFKPYIARSNWITIVGGLIESKGHKYLFDAFKNIQDVAAEWSIHVIGDGVLKKELENYVKNLSIHDKVKFYGSLPNVKVFEVLANSKIFALPSYKEGFGISYLEAMLCAVPVIGIRGEGISDVIRNNENGILVTAQSVVSLQQSIERLILDPGLSEKIGLAARDWVVNKYLLGSSVDKVIQELQGIRQR